MQIWRMSPGAGLDNKKEFMLNGRERLKQPAMGYNKHSQIITYNIITYFRERPKNNQLTVLSNHLTN
jgi:hypothetical protein